MVRRRMPLPAGVGLRSACRSPRRRRWCRICGSRLRMWPRTGEPRPAGLLAPHAYAPIVALDPPDGIVIDSTGAAHLHGGEVPMLEALTGRLAMSGDRGSGRWPNLGAAHALARFPVAIWTDMLAYGGAAAARRPPWPVCGHRLWPIGDLLAQPRAPLTRRFGPELTAASIRALGHAPEPIEPYGLQISSNRAAPSPSRLPRPRP